MKILSWLLISLSFILIIPFHTSNIKLSISNDFVAMAKNYQEAYSIEEQKLSNKNFSYSSTSNKQLGELLEYVVFTFLPNMINKVSMFLFILALIVLRIEKGLFKAIFEAFKFKLIILCIIQLMVYTTY